MPLLSFYRPDALPAAQPTASKHWRHEIYKNNELISLHSSNEHKQIRWQRRPWFLRWTWLKWSFEWLSAPDSQPCLLSAASRSKQTSCSCKPTQSTNQHQQPTTTRRKVPTAAMHGSFNRIHQAASKYTPSNNTLFHRPTQVHRVPLAGKYQSINQSIEVFL